jgi:hypothetical protein
MLRYNEMRREVQFEVRVEVRLEKDGKDGKERAFTRGDWSWGGSADTVQLDG